MWLRMQNETCYDEQNEEDDAEDLLADLEVTGARMTDHLQQEREQVEQECDDEERLDGVVAVFVVMATSVFAAVVVVIIVVVVVSTPTPAPTHREAARRNGHRVNVCRKRGQHQCCFGEIHRHRVSAPITRDVVLQRRSNSSSSSSSRSCRTYRLTWHKLQ